ncbi:hypothetical protein FIBSPDRAFT_945951 [Athelia psychrophila]|uniref:Uncharacterized protein n=1 Tax=Athelia psychrophila TaxID=1759441 RepID=A0A166THD1_9AGAM|nr:hypothetical protein FIBSPDRAFT_945951 [Fibularhizoctonia sp. CBS 109695]
MGNKKNIWKAIRLQPSHSSAELSSPPTNSASSAPVAAQYERVRTTRDVRRAYNTRQNVMATSTGTYALSHARRSLSAPNLVPDEGLASSVSHTSTPVLSARLTTSL